MRLINYDRKIYIYRNLRKQTLSLLQSGLLVGHAEAVILTDVEFRVRESGRQRVLREKQKNVHSFAIGFLEESYEMPYVWVIDSAEVFNTGTSREVTYNPYKFGYFYDRISEAPVYKGKRVLVTANSGIFVED